jgi:hypothetical protein
MLNVAMFHIIFSTGAKGVGDSIFAAYMEEI